MVNRSIMSYALGLSLCLGAGAALADQVTPRDRKFLEEAMRGGMDEVALGRLAKDRGQLDDVKNFGQRMVDDHSKADDQLVQQASRLGVLAPPGLTTKDANVMDRLGRLSGVAFDQHYMDMMVSDHKKDIALFQMEANKGDDPALRRFASTTLPTLQSHLAMALDAQQKVKHAQSASR